MKKFFSLFLALTMLFTLAACGGDAEPAADPETTPETETADEPIGGGMQIANPWTDCETLDDAESIAGVSITLPDSLGESDEQIFRACESGQMLELIFRSGESELRIRKAPGSDDISGDYTAYAQESTVTDGGYEVTLKGSGDLVQLAVWSSGGFAYAVSLSEGMTSEEMLALAAEIA